MSLYDTCSTCNGKGVLPCGDCKCRTCNASGKVNLTCSACQSGKVQCTYCHGTGQVLEKKGFFSDKYKTCIICDGTRKKHCPTCKGTATVEGPCSACGGSGRIANCGCCGAKGTVMCTACKGEGRFEGQWVKSLHSMSVDRLRFEYEKRQREISNLLGKMSNAEQELRDSNESYEQAYACRQPDFDASGYNRYNTGLMNEIDYAERQTRGLQEELNAIERVLDKKWK